MQQFPWQAFAQNSAYANQIALRNSQGDPFTWAELAEKINQVEAFLLQQGVTVQSAVESLNIFLQGRLERFKQPVAYYELPQDLIQGAIKISRKALADWLSQQ